MFLNFSDIAILNIGNADHFCSISRISKSEAINLMQNNEHKSCISINNIDTNKIVFSKKVSFGKKGFKYFIGYKLHIKVTFMNLNIYLS